MAIRTDAHAHFFWPGYASFLPESCRRREPDELTLYLALAQQHNVQQVLAVGYEGEPWANGNNDYLVQLAANHPWIRPLAFISQPAALAPLALEWWQQKQFVGLSFYIFDEQQVMALDRVPAEVWEWLVGCRWLISVNSRGPSWQGWTPIMERYPELRLLISHLGLPPPVAQPPAEAAARQQLRRVLELAQFPNVHIKLSGFYALTEPGYDYPHGAAWPYVEVLLQGFGARRLLWGSDFSPSLEWLSFPQTFGMFSHMPFLEETEREQIEGENLRALLDEVVSSS